MTRTINKTILIGHLGDEPQLNSTVANFRIATTESWKDKQSGNLQQHTEWHKVVAFRKTAEIVAEYLHKGSHVYIEGKLRTRKWQDNNGNDRYTTEIIADSVNLLDKIDKKQEEDLPF